MSGNITKPGITADLEAMREMGLGGTLFMNVSVALPTGLVATKDFMSPAWQDCFQHMLNESARLGLDFGSALCDGWGNERQTVVLSGAAGDVVQLSYNGVNATSASGRTRRSVSRSHASRNVC